MIIWFICVCHLTSFGNTRMYIISNLPQPPLSVSKLLSLLNMLQSYYLLFQILLNSSNDSFSRFYEIKNPNINATTSKRRECKYRCNFRSNLPKYFYHLANFVTIKISNKLKELIFPHLTWVLPQYQVVTTARHHINNCRDICGKHKNIGLGFLCKQRGFWLLTTTGCLSTIL